MNGVSAHDIDIGNRHMVAGTSAGIVIMNPPRSPLSNAEALVLAAWLVALDEDDGGNFQTILERVLET